MKKEIKILNKKIILTAIKDSFVKLNPSLQIKNPVIFIVAIGALITTIIVIIEIIQ